MKSLKEKAVLAYSGGLDTSIIISWLKEHYNLDIIACCVDVGQGDELLSLKEKAMTSGASKVYVEDVKKEFIEHFIFPTLKAGAVYEGKYLLGTAFARPLIAKKLVEVAEKEGAKYIAHGCTGKGNDQVRFELSIKSLNPDLKIIAPWRLWDIKSREDEIEYAKQRNIPITVSVEKPYSMDKNIWHLSHEGGELEDTWIGHSTDMYMTTISPEKAPDTPCYIEIGFEKGLPVSINGIFHDPLTILEKLNKIGGDNGIGIADIVENRLVGMKSRGVYETPGGTILYTAHKELEYLILDRSTMQIKDILANKYAQLVYDGLWYTPLREAMDAFVDSTQEYVTGSVKLKLYKGSCTNVGAKSPYSLYNKDFATFGEDEVFNQKDSEGFINLFGLPITIKALMNKTIKEEMLYNKSKKVI